MTNVTTPTTASEEVCKINENLEGAADRAAPIDMTPTWGEVGLLIWRLAVSNEQKALEAAQSEFQRAFAGMAVLNKLLPTLTPEQHAIYKRVFADELAKQVRR